MDILNSIILGIVQGLTEFLPISSSGHLILVRDVLGLNFTYGLSFDAVLQLATTLAIIVYFRKDIWNLVKTFFRWISGKTVEKKEKILLLAIIVGTIPAGVLGFLLEEQMETVFRNPKLVAITLIVGAVIMWLAERGARQDKELTTKKGFKIGLYQALALVPGMSRSGMSISGGLLMGMSRAEATRFSFLLAFPVLLGSGLKKLFELNSNGLLDSIGVDLLAGSIASFLVGIFAIHFLLKFLRNHTLNTFVIYRIVVAILLIIFI